MKPQWEKEFEELIECPDLIYIQGQNKEKSLKSFIKSQREQAVKEALGKIEKILPKERKAPFDPERDANDGAKIINIDDVDMGFNSCLYLIKEALKKDLTNLLR